MRQVLALAMIGFLVACAPAIGVPPRACPDAGTAEGAVCAFYERYLELRPSGLPTAEQQAAFAPWLSERLERGMDAAREVQTAFRTQHPDQKPPLVDGCLFASLFEGPTEFTVGVAVSAGGATRVPVRFRYGADAEWQDVIIVTREHDRFVIDDIEFAGAGPFNPAGRLSEVLQQSGQ
jgi:hypothetical protein